ncbi:MAG: hypothetical protein KF684_11990 [Phycisphaeraceae bacterium]|nr:hypothetical protein [Phycisphaeraceae bacterium]
MAISKATILCARLAALAGATAGLTHPRTVHAGTQPVRWASPVSGLWSDDAAWDSGVAPGAPGALTPPDVVIDASGAPFVVSLNDSRRVNSLMIGGPSAQLQVVSGGVLEVLGQASSTSRLVLSVGTLRGGNWTSLSDGIRLMGLSNVLDSVTFSNPGPTVLTSGSPGALVGAFVTGSGLVSAGPIVLDNARLVYNILDAAIDYDITLQQGELFFPAADGLATITDGSTVSGSGQIRITGGGKLVNDGTISNSGALNMTLGTGTIVNNGLVRFRDTASSVTSGAFENRGELRLENGASLTMSSRLDNFGDILLLGSSLNLSGRLTNQGVIYAQNSTITMSGNDRLGDLGSTVFVNSTLVLSDGVNTPTNPTLNLGSHTLRLSNATLRNATLVGEGQLRLEGTSNGSYTNILENVTLTGGNTEMTGGSSTSVSLSGSFSTTGSELLVRGGTLVFRSDFTLENSTVRVGAFGAGANGQLGITQSSSLTIGPTGHIIANTSGRTLTSIGGIATRTLNNNGTITVETGAGLSFVGAINLINRGLIQVGASGIFTTPGAWDNQGLITVATLGEFRMAGQFTSAHIGQIDGAMGSVAVAGLWTLGNDGYRLSDLGSSLVMRSGALRNGTLDLAGLPIQFASQSSADFQNVVFTGGDIDVAPTFQLRLIDDISMSGGTMRFATAAPTVIGVTTRLHDGDYELRGGGLARTQPAPITPTLFIQAGATLRGFSGLVAPSVPNIEVHAGGTLRAEGGQLSTNLVTVQQGGAAGALGAGASLAVSTMTNAGLVRAESGGAINANGLTNTGTLHALSGVINATFLTNNGQAQIDHAGSMVVNHLTNNADIHSVGGMLTVQNSLNNSGSISVTAGGTFLATRTGSTLWQNTGSILIQESTLRLAGSWDRASLTSIQMVDADLRIVGSLNSLDGPVTFDGARSITINGSMNMLDSLADFGDRDVTVLSSVLRGNLANARFLAPVAGSQISLERVSLSNANLIAGASGLRFSTSGQFLTSGTLEFAPGASGRFVPVSGQISLGHDAEIVGSDIDFELRNRFTNDGTIRAIAPAPDAQNSGAHHERVVIRGAANGETTRAFLNNGSVIADGGRFVLGPDNSHPEGVTFLNMTGSVLLGGEWIARNGGWLDFGDRPVLFNLATMRLEGQNSRFDAMRTVADNLSVFEVVDHDFDSTGAHFSNRAQAIVRLDRSAVTLASLENAGTIALTDSANLRASSLTLFSESVLALSLTGADDASTLTITSNAALDGVLEVALSGGYDPGWGDSWRILSAGVVSGDFSALLLPELADDSLTWWSSRTETDYLLGVRHIADLDNDGTVGFSDLNTLLADFGVAGSGLAGDINADGVVDFADLNTLLGAYGLSAARAVPTPGAAIVFLSAGAVLGLRRRERA